VGAEALVRGASRLAEGLGLSPLFIGLTLVAFGTSSPELVVSLLAAARDLPDVAVGNVVGSNIFNVGVVLGIGALVAPLHCHLTLVRRDAPLVIAVTVALGAFAIGGSLARWEAGALLAALLLYTAWSYRSAVREGRGRPSEEPAPGTSPTGHSGGVGRPRPRDLLLTLLGLGALALGATWVVDGAVEIAGALGVSEAVIGLTIVAAGTSLPELATSAVAAFRGESDIAVANVLGSNVFNVLGILGIAGLVRPLAIPSRMLWFDIPVALAFAVACIPLMTSARRISRLEGLLLCLGYVVYCVVSTVGPVG
jgi:cation:H+ antiporter